MSVVEREKVLEYVQYIYPKMFQRGGGKLMLQLSEDSLIIIILFLISYPWETPLRVSTCSDSSCIADAVELNVFES